MQMERLQAVVLSSIDYGERDRIVSLFTLEHGRLKGFARGARNSRKRFGPALESFARIDVQLSHKDGLSSLQSADVISLYTGIRGDLGTIAHGLYACELVEFLTPEGHPLPRLFRLLIAYLEHLDGKHGDTPSRRMFEINLLNILGYRPSLEECSRCGSQFTRQGAFIQQGGELLCRFCTATGRTIALTTLQRLKACLSTGHFDQIDFDIEAQLQGGALLDAALCSHSSRKFKCLDFLQQTCGD
ncbi:MAG: DNA repair protein RecO [Desulfuromonadaceae bacterium]|nr:DNA repair protein RecO [Desulfuromonadaceae bacterium]MDD5105486.1 DNA repair protein RecO [Desulfuromonadaceae bacterium]